MKFRAGKETGNWRKRGLSLEVFVSGKIRAMIFIVTRKLKLKGEVCIFVILEKLLGKNRV